MLVGRVIAWEFGRLEKVDGTITTPKSGDRELEPSELFSLLMR